MKTLSLTALALLISTQAFAGDAGMAKVGDIVIHESWARASIGQAPNSAAYMTLMTGGETTDKLVSVSTPAAEKAELHTHIMDGDIAKMRPIEAIEVNPGEPAVLKPGGLHVMLIGLTGTLSEGATLPLTLTFENAGEVTFDVPVRGMGGKDRGGMKHGDGHMNHGS